MSGFVEFSADARSKTIGQNYRCRAWVNFDGSITFSPNPSTSAIRGSGNVSSITSMGTGDFKINFTTPMPSTNYSVVGIMDNGGSGVWLSSLEIYYVGSFSTTEIRINTTRVSSTSNRTYADMDYNCVAIFN